MEESRTEKRLKRQSLLGARRARAAVQESQTIGAAEEEGEERRGEKHLKCQSLPAAPRVRAAWPAPCSSFLAASAEQRVAPGGDGRTVRRWINGRSCGKECRGVGGAEGASGAPSPGAERLPGLAGWGTAKRPELRKRNGGEQDGEASEAAESPGSAESESCGAGEPNDWSCGRRREERRGEKHLKCQSLPAAPRVRAAVSRGPSGPCHPSCASWALPGSLSFPHCYDYFFFLLLCTFFLHLSLTCPHLLGPPSFCPAARGIFFLLPLFLFSSRLLVLLSSYSVACQYFCCLWCSLSASSSLDSRPSFSAP
ncbi:uncharacterized protein LOC142359018 isoform X2 [Opisthocomus hoazin]